MEKRNLKSYGYSRVTFKKLNLNTSHNFKIRAGNDRIVFLCRIDILKHTWILIIRKNAFMDHIDDIAYGYL